MKPWSLLVLGVSCSSQLASASASTSPRCAPDLTATAPVGVKAMHEVVLWSPFYEPIIRSLVKGGLGVVYRAKLAQDDAAEKMIPGLHDAMIQAALIAGLDSLERDLARAKQASSNVISSGIPFKQLARLAYLFGPFVNCNKAIQVDFLATDTTLTAADRALKSLQEDAAYQVRARKVKSKPGMADAIKLLDLESKVYQQALMAAAAAAAKAGTRAAKDHANIMAAQHGYDPFYPGA